jgi:quercetin dioxygenase-like cupin family protein
MEIDRPGRDSERGAAEQFTGSVWTDVIAAPSQSSLVAVYSVHFAPGARTAWHAHPAGQVLHVTEGAGLVRSGANALRRSTLGTRCGPSPANGIGTVQGWRRS